MSEERKKENKGGGQISLLGTASTMGLHMVSRPHCGGRARLAGGQVAQAPGLRARGIGSCFCSWPCRGLPQRVDRRPLSCPDATPSATPRKRPAARGGASGAGKNAQGLRLRIRQGRPSWPTRRNPWRPRERERAERQDDVTASPYSRRRVIPRSGISTSSANRWRPYAGNCGNTPRKSGKRTSMSIIEQVDRLLWRRGFIHAPSAPGRTEESFFSFPC